MLGNFLEKFKRGLSKTREGLTGKISEVLRRKPELDEEALEEIEEILIRADVGVNATLRIIDRLRERLQEGPAPERTEDWVRALLEDELLEILRAVRSPNLKPSRTGPHVILVAGVNGSGKTTTIGKLACRYGARGKRVLLAACDTFRAAAIDQLSIWSERSGADIVRHRPGADAASVAFDALAAARSRDVDVVLIDTAGRLHTSINLMEELKKIRRVLGKCLPDAPHETLLVLDATTGQNAVAQARQFHADIGITGLVLAKLDGTARGGIVIAIADELGLPVSMVGMGEGRDDLSDFEPEAFVAALFKGD
ncbi:MAG: signal recognition particle-docking protein FtsY [Candidatus Latescibacteria bacterium]|nr:signal recognition particle-docking protein FtsY [Candidatus Latescibacterota bacterium]